MEDNENNPKNNSKIEEKSKFLETAETKTYPDGGWGWIVASACFVVRFIKQLVQPCFGILFYDLLLEFGTSSVTIGWIYNLHIVMEQSAKFFAGPLGDTLGWKKVVVACGLMASVAVYCLIYATNVVYLFIFFSLIGGSTLGLSSSISHVIVPHYFKKNLGKAMAVGLFGVCFGHFSGPLLSNFLLKEYGYKGTILILSGIILNIVVAGTIFNPVDWDQPKQTTTSQKSSATDVLRRVYTSSVKNFAALKSWQGVLLAYSISSFNAANFNFVMLVSFVFQYRGYTIDDVAWTLSIVAICNAACRIVCSISSDSKFFNKRCVYTIAQLGLSAVIIGFIFLEELVLLQCAGGLYGICSGACASLYSLVMLDVLGLRLFKAAYGLSGIMSAFCAITIGPLIGLVKDISGSYSISLAMLSSLFFTGFLSCALLPFAARHDDRKVSISPI